MTSLLPNGLFSNLYFTSVSKLNTPPGTSRFGQNQNTDEFNDEALKSLRSADGEDNGIGSVGIGSVGLGAGDPLASLKNHNPSVAEQDSVFYTNPSILVQNSGATGHNNGTAIFWNPQNQ